MEEIAISKFKATCLAVLEKVKKTGQPVLVTRFGHPSRANNASGSSQARSKVWDRRRFFHDPWRHCGGL